MQEITIKNNFIEPSTQLENCNFIKTVLMLLVVFYHSILFWKGDWFTVIQPFFEAKHLSYLANWLNTFHIYGFTLVSGYIFFFLKNETNRYNNFKIFIRNKIKRLIIPYLIVSVLWVIPISLFFFPDWNLHQIASKFLLGTAPSQLWFLLMLFNVFIICYPITNLLTNNKPYKTAAICILLYCLGVLGQKYCCKNYFQIWTSLKYIPYFLAGCYIRKFNIQTAKIPWYIYIAIDLIFYAIYITLANGFKSLVLILLTMIGALMSYAVLQQLAQKINWKNNKLFIIISNLSMPIYLFHQQIIYICIYYLNGKLPPYLHAFINLFFALAVSTIISKICLNHNISRFFIGSK